MPVPAPAPAPVPAVGRSVRRKDATSKITGRAQYIDDLRFPGMIYGRTIRSTIPRGRIRAIAREGIPEDFVVVDHRDIPGKNYIALLVTDQPCLVEQQVNHMAEPILLLAHEDREALWRLAVGIEYEAEAPNFDPAAAGHSFKDIRITKGDVDAGMAAADVIIEGEYRTGHHEQLYIEPNGVIAVPGEDGSITLYGSLQCPYYVHAALKVVMDLPDDRVRVIQTETGGGFGGKEDYPSIIACHAALLARKSGRPVKLVYDRHEDMIATTKRHPSIVRHRTGVKRDGTITAMDIDERHLPDPALEGADDPLCRSERDFTFRSGSAREDGDVQGFNGLAHERKDSTGFGQRVDRVHTGSS